MMKQSLLLVVLFIGFICAKKISINPDDNKCVDEKSCFTNQTSCCKTLMFVLNNLMDFNDTILNLSGSNHTLSNALEIKYVENFTIQSNQMGYISCAYNKSGLLFTFANSIVIQRITFQYCGAYRISTTCPSSDGFINVTEVLRFAFSRDVSIIDSNFVKNQGVAVAVYDTVGQITIRNSTFIENTDENNRTTVTSGCGLYVEFTNCGILDPCNCTYNQTQTSYIHNANFDISGSLFERNIAERNPATTIPVPPYNEYQHFSFGKGGGLAFILLGRASNNTFTVKNSKFISNHAQWGGGVYKSVRNYAQANEFHFSHLLFDSNNATFGGGGIRLHSFVMNDPGVTLASKVEYTGLNFTKNSAIYGGGLSISGTTREIYDEFSKRRNIVIDKCIFHNNSATVGFGIGLATWNLKSDTVGTSYRVIISDSKFLNNHFVETEDRKVIGQGTLYSDEASVLFKGENIFIGNKNTAVVFDSCSVKFGNNSYTLFENNTGQEGGAMAMYGNSWLIVSKNSTVIFKRNMAHTKGGAIYNRYPGPPRVSFLTTNLQTEDCFLRYEDQTKKKHDWPVSIQFIKNSAPKYAGNSIYASTLQFCREINEGRTYTKAFEWKFIKYVPLNNDLSAEVVTNAVNIEVSDWHPIPNLPFNASLNITDEKKQSVFSTVRLNIEHYSTPVELSPPNNIFYVKDSIKQLQILGQSKAKFKFRLESTSGQLITSSYHNGEMEYCKMGFNQEGNTCKCTDKDNSDVIMCTKNGDVYMVKGKWANNDTKTKRFKTYSCPEGYCQCHNVNSGVHKEFMCLLKENDQCAKGREGKLCGKCKEGLSVVWGMEECKKCDSRYAFLIILVLAITSLFVIFILYFNIDAFSGYLNCFLYSYQMIPVILPKSITLDPFISVVIGLTSLSGTGNNIGVCIINGMNNLEKLALNYTVPVYMFVFTILVGICIPTTAWNKCFQRRNKFEAEMDLQVRKRSFGSALSFVLVYSYSIITRVTIQLLRSVEINGENYLYLAAEVRMFDSQHVGYGVLAIFMLIFIVILFPLVLLFPSFFEARFKPLQRWAPVLDVLKDCFKDGNKYRMFAAFYFLCRLVLLGLNNIQNNSHSALMLIFNIIVLAVFAYVKPYKQPTYNMWDVLLLCNMCLINVMCLTLNVPYILDDLFSVFSIFIKICVYIPLVTVACRLTAYIYNRCTISREESKTRPTRSEKISGRIRRWRSRRKELLAFPERVVEDFDSDYVEFR